MVVTIRKGAHDTQTLDRLHRQIRKRPGNLDVYLEFTGLEGIRRAIFKVGPALKIKHDADLETDIESAVGAGNVRLLGQGGTTTQAPLPAPPRSRRPRSWSAMKTTRES